MAWYCYIFYFSYLDNVLHVHTYVNKFDSNGTELNFLDDPLPSSLTEEDLAAIRNTTMYDVIRAVTTLSSDSIQSSVFRWQNGNYNLD